jgi:hypothetical protein
VIQYAAAFCLITNAAGYRVARSSRAMTTVYDARLTAIAAAVGLTFDDLLGEMNQQPLCTLIPQFVKRPQQAQFE